MASTVIFWVRSPRATAWATCEMLRTWSVRFEAIMFTDSVRPRQVPDTPATSAWPPSALGADLLGHARDLGGERVELVDHRVDGVLELEDLALGVDGDLRDRSPLATAVVTSAMSAPGSVRFDAMKFTDSVRLRQVPDTSSTSA